MTKIALIFPHQLFKESKMLKNIQTVYLIESDLYFTQYKFHQQKIVLHRASMKFYEDYLQQQHKTVVYTEFSTKLAQLFQRFQQQQVTEVHYTDTTDYLLEKRLKNFAQQYNIILVKYESPNFLTTKDDIIEMLAQEKKYLMASFYIKQRKKLNILVEDGSPVGGKWSFDTENRKKAPKNLIIPQSLKISENKYVKEAQNYIKIHFKEHYGVAKTFNYPTTFAEAEQVLENFLYQKLKFFGDYEDAILQNETFMFHSLLTPALNIGLLSPQQIIDKTLLYAQQNNIPLNSLEGFIRQIIGWREFMRGIYEVEGAKQRTKNFWQYDRKLTQHFWNGTTGLLPFDILVKKLKKDAYSHHIERLMIAGNLMHLCDFAPNDVYQWFMEFYIDAYDWVMVPNVYGMSQYADGGLMTTKPYVSGSNYLLKMSNFEKGSWCNVWDGLYWRYIWKNREVFSKNIRMSLPVNLVNKMDKDVLYKHLNNADKFLEFICI
jgi:deoxyribodipyrimidine photolyase-related protein